MEIASTAHRLSLEYKKKNLNLKGSELLFEANLFAFFSNTLFPNCVRDLYILNIFSPAYSPAIIL